MRRNKAPFRAWMGIFVLYVCQTAGAAETTNPTSVFEKPTEASKQIEILEQGSEVPVSGEVVQSGGTSWVPIHTQKGTGWVKLRQVELKSGDVGYELKAPSRTHLWFSFGPSLLATNDNYFGARLSLGIDWYLGSERRFIIGILSERYFSGESIGGAFSGNIIRGALIPNIGYFLVPGTLWLRLGEGLAAIGGSNSNFGSKIKPTTLASVGYQLSLGTRSALGVEFSFEHTGQAKTSTTPIADSFGGALGDNDPTGTAPAANIYTLDFRYSFEL